MREWRQTTIGELCDSGWIELQTGPFGSQLHAYDYVDSGIPVVPTEAIRNRRIDHSVLPKITSAKARELERHRLHLGDILFARRGVQATGHIGCVRENEVGFICGTGAIRLRVTGRSSDVSADFLSHVLANPASVEWFKFHAIGATMPNLNEGIIRSFSCKLPPVSDQLAIAYLLSALDDKIELNRTMNETLEAVARAIFSDWLAHHADQLGRSRVADLIASGIMLIGDGYRAKNDELGAPGLPFIRAGELKNGFDTQGADVLNERSVTAAGEKISQIGDVAFTSKGTVGRFARVATQTPRFVYSPQVCFWRSIDSARLRPGILYAWMVSEDLKSQIDAVAGQTDMALYVSLRDQRAMTIPVFGPGQHAIADVIDPLLRRQDVNLAESHTLADLRNFVLPRLMSGEIRVKDAETALETIQ